MNNVFTVLHMFCGIGGGALGFQQALCEYGGMVGTFRTLTGIDCDPLACQDFERLTGVPAVQMDLFTRQDYITFYGHEPPIGWRQIEPSDIRKACDDVCPDAIFLSPPCKGFSGLLPQKSAKSEKYQALNRLVVRSMELIMAAFPDDLPSVILIENVPRITTRGSRLIKQVEGVLKKHQFALDGHAHDCGEIGGLGQHRKRYLLIARNEKKMPTFIYKPPKLPLKTIGDVIGPIPMPDDHNAGPMHRLPRLQWKTWVRLALIPAGGDWRDLEKIDHTQYRIEYAPRAGAYGVQDWNAPGTTVTSETGANNGNISISDPRLTDRDSRHGSVYQILKYNQTSPCVTGTRFGSGAPAIADPKVNFRNDASSSIYKIANWQETAATITGAAGPNNGAISVSDPRIAKRGFSNCYQVESWDEVSATVTGIPDIQSGAQSIADPLIDCTPRSGTMGVNAWDQPSKTVIGAGDIHAGTTAVADPRIPENKEQGVWIIVAPDGTWHRPLTTLELAALQSFPLTMPDGTPLKLAGNSDARWREAIGNAVPPEAAKAIAQQILPSLMANKKNEWFLSPNGVWVLPTASHEIPQNQTTIEGVSQ